MKKRTKIVATLGPSSDTLDKIIALVRAGVNVFRLNFSHNTHEYHLKVLNSIKMASEQTGLTIGILQDISGPKIRIGDLEETFEVHGGDIVEISKDEILGYKVDDSRYILSISQPKVLDSLCDGDHIFFCDGQIRTKTIEIKHDKIVLEVLSNGILSSHKGVNFPNTKIDIDVLTPKDIEDIKWGIENGVDFMAISFVQNAKDVLKARSVVNSFNGDVQIFAKIEKFDAVENIDEIISVSDGIMVARGDLGIEIPYYEVPQVQKMIIKKANELSKPVITATQMLLSMTNSNNATRAEISDVANAILDGTDAVMLSEETTVGKYPIEAVTVMMETIKATEKSTYPYYKFFNYEMHDVTDGINYSAARLSSHLKTDGIITMTNSGDSAKKIARYRPSQTIYAVVHSEKTARLLTVVWGVVPAFLVNNGSIGQMLNQVLTDGVNRKVLSLDKSYILTAGDPAGIRGSTNMIRLLRHEEMEFFIKLNDLNNYKG
ncbi:pyruvate kinase [Arcobacter sp. FWKO B]|uniref:pyruvate kinase n=1 Tax=Arcobacter sp. FWKO B TaxID=2593672 RepID=UPI0018A37A01|nr:pyruvate kinase [Arcobacter sp. FWKO B]QOG11468.1 pyruvate kinase [Arcobacter sp. FWKO B]